VQRSRHVVPLGQGVREVVVTIHLGTCSVRLECGCSCFRPGGLSEVLTAFEGATGFVVRGEEDWRDTSVSRRVAYAAGEHTHTYTNVYKHGILESFLPSEGG
jgi:hypothetical protein